ncbi:MAG: hypothetical protein JSR57_11465 [Verrucomicrobia bacterium]|nr:hypothetical protein [Verrucomicrobiota bacterium]
MRKMVKIKLKEEKTIDYFCKQLNEGNLLSETIFKMMDFDDGNFFTLLPKESSQENIYSFSFGGIIPSTSYGEEKYFVSCMNEEVLPMQVKTVDEELSSFIFEYLHKDAKNCAIFEDVLSNPTDSFLKKTSVNLLLNKNEVYYLLNTSNSIADIFHAIRLSSHSWHFVAILSKQLSAPPKAIDEYFRSLCVNCQYIIVGAYDGEAYVFWERNVIGSEDDEGTSVK